MNRKLEKILEVLFWISAMATLGTVAFTIRQYAETPMPPISTIIGVVITVILLFFRLLVRAVLNANPLEKQKIAAIQGLEDGHFVHVSRAAGGPVVIVYKIADNEYALNPGDSFNTAEKALNSAAETAKYDKTDRVKYEIK